MVESEFIPSVKKLFAYYKQLGEKCFDQLKDEELFVQSSDQNNSIAIMVNHLWGNMMSRWTNFLTSDGEKETRQRDLEFETVILTRKEMMRKWEEGWTCLFNALDSVGPNDITSTVYIRNQGHTVTEAIQRQLAHYAYHVGQIVFLSKEFRKEEWQSLSIPKGKSGDYNTEKFNQEKAKAHFTDESLTKEN